MSSYNSMKSKLIATGLYTLEDSSNTSEELKAFAQELDIIFDTLDEMTREYFIATAQSYGIIERERFIGKERSELPTEQRREMLIDVKGNRPERFYNHGKLCNTGCYGDDK